MELHNFAPDFDPTHPQVQQLVHNLQPTHITFLPDAHLGPTAPVGFAARTTRVCPSVIGGDAGCGFLMLEVKPVRVDFQALQEFLERVVPFQETPVHTVTVVQEFFEFAMSITQCPNTPTFSEFTTRRKRFEYQFRSSIQLSSLGSGNHFVEIGRSSTSGMMAVTVHSGSRNAGQAVYQQFQQVCQVFALHGVKCQTALFTKLLDEIHAGNQVHLPILLQGPFKRAVSARFRGGTPTALSLLRTTTIEEEQQLVLPDEYVPLYRETVEFLTIVAHVNRAAIALQIRNYLGMELLSSITGPHNFIRGDILRKGSQAADGKFIVALNCRDGILVCQSSTIESAPHGSGRAGKKTELKHIPDEGEAGDVVRFWRGYNEGPGGYKDSTAAIQAIKAMGIDIVDRVMPLFSYKRGK
ncbi:RNA-splicing ligase RtcB [Spironucleus salmonicida]|uniref:3'-phosphate/5'-hydroxy nucleic acid ligase n=1 Tax=Spironucleus salmonicida TaxID=348837 RepID=V6LSZ1_9EUKA|nr:RNA-splicing ligase RtcB [Spironucleus salmonicida]KAH0570176.1 RNA-splicing ligase RtcB [Spironucleus salmonicida]|eukprot:EST47680.1 hypothetical protein SS50377_12236 [Spironucleus salmonicida]